MCSFKYKFKIALGYKNLKKNNILKSIRLLNLHTYGFHLINTEKGQLLEIHLLEKTARHQNLDCSTPFEQMTKIFASARKSKKYAVHVLSSICIF